MWYNRYNYTNLTYEVYSYIYIFTEETYFSLTYNVGPTLCIYIFTEETYFSLTYNVGPTLCIYIYIYIYIL